jgi:hypothetical protein
VRPLRRSRLTVARGSPVTSSGYRRDHDVAFADAGVAHGVAFHAVGEVVPVLPGRSILYRRHRRGRSGGDRELRQRSTWKAGRSRPSITGYSCRTREACRWASGLGGENAKDGDRASLARRPVNPSELSAFRWAAPSLPQVLQARRALERWGAAARSDRVVKRPEDSPSWGDWDPSPQRPQARRNCYDGRTEVRLRRLRQSWEYGAPRRPSLDPSTPSGGGDGSGAGPVLAHASWPAGSSAPRPARVLHGRKLGLPQRTPSSARVS